MALGAEESGHILFDDVPAGDGVIAGLRALAIGLASGALATAAAGFQRWPRRVGKLRVSARVPLDTTPGVAALVQEGEAALGERGRVFLRYSGTEPVLRVLVEGRSDDAVHAVFAAVMAGLSRALG